MIKYKKIFEDANSPYKSYKGNQRFAYFNKLLFGNAISKEYRVVFGLLRSSFILGVCDINNKIITLNKNQLPEQALDLVLIHEMIHALVEDINDPHGVSFKTERHRIEKMFGYDIPYSETLNGLEKVLDELGL